MLRTRGVYPQSIIRFAFSMWFEIAFSKAERQLKYKYYQEFLLIRKGVTINFNNLNSHV